MSALKQKLARLGATAGVLAATTAAILAVGGAEASSALAAPTCVNIPTAKLRNLKGQGSTLQKVSQELWTGRKVPPAPETLPYTAIGGGYAAECTGAENATFSYEGTGSGAALNAFGFNSGTTLNKEYAYIGTDEAPSGPQITQSTSTNSAAPVIIPVAQTAIAVVVNKPASCVIKGGITWKDLNLLFAGKIRKWSEISTIENKATCEGAETGEITRVVREDGSGTTYQFKNYLSELETGHSGSAPGQILNTVTSTCETKNWSQLRTGGGSPNLNLAWPENETVCAANGKRSPIHRVSGGGALVNYVKSAEHPNTIGYAAYSDVFTNGATANAVSLQNEEPLGAPTYAAPGKGATLSEANCGSRTYVVPSNATTGEGLEVDWSEVFGAKPTIGGTAYPLCTLTFDVGWNGYSTAGYEEGTQVGKAVAAYFNYLLNEGQTVLGAHGYAALPSPSAPANNVLAAAKYPLEHNAVK